MTEPHKAAKELFDSCMAEEVGLPDGAAFKAAYYVFSELTDRAGIDRARWIFRHFGRDPTQSRRNEIKNFALLDRLDMMTDETGKPSPVYLRLAKQLAEENKSLPKSERKGPGGTDVVALAKHIENQDKKRTRSLLAGTWRGPITHDQAVRHFRAKNLATTPGKSFR